MTLLDVRSAPGVTLVTHVPCDRESADHLRQLQRIALDAPFLTGTGVRTRLSPTAA